MAETSWVLRLAIPICTIASGEDDAERGVTDLQLILTPRPYSTYKRFVGRKFRLKATGKLTHAITGHHHTAVLLEVAEISRGG
ncbi:MAG: hypothetical protein QOJ64_3027 [Acidobacteriota bacterium]|nr:hypothetical protein [Acidobacteriota bacterium]